MPGYKKGEAVLIRKEDLSRYDNERYDLHNQVARLKDDLTRRDCEIRCLKADVEAHKKLYMRQEGVLEGTGKSLDKVLAVVERRMR